MSAVFKGTCHAAVMRWIEEITGAPLPVSLRAFWEAGGGINFIWDYESDKAPDLGVDLPMDEMDRRTRRCTRRPLLSLVVRQRAPV